MLTGITYNCDTESLADLDQAAFAEAFENEVRTIAKFRDLSITVTFNSWRSEVTGFVSDDWEADISHEEEFHEQIAQCAERAFSYCLAND